MFNLYIRDGYPAIVEIDQNGSPCATLPFGIMVKDMPFSDDMRWHTVTPDASGDKRMVYDALLQNETIRYVINPQSVAPNSIARPRSVVCHVYLLDGTHKSFPVELPF